jgi:hypothetical protein
VTEDGIVRKKRKNRTDERKKREESTRERDDEI